MLSHIKNAPIASMMKVKPNIYNKVEMRELNVSLPIMSRRANWLKSPVPPIKKMAKKLVIVMMPRPPICMRSAMTICPS